MEATCDISLKTWLTDEEAQVYLSLSRETLRQSRNDADLTYYKDKGKSIRYKREDLDDYMKRRFSQRFKAVQL